MAKIADLLAEAASEDRPSHSLKAGDMLRHPGGFNIKVHQVSGESVHVEFEDESGWHTHTLDGKLLQDLCK